MAETLDTDKKKDRFWDGVSRNVMEAETNKEALELLSLLGGWRPKGQLVYRLRELGVGWAAIKAVCPSCESLGGRWARRYGRKWPV